MKTKEMFSILEMFNRMKKKSIRTIFCPAKLLFLTMERLIINKKDTEKAKLFIKMVQLMMVIGQEIFDMGQVF